MKLYWNRWNILCDIIEIESELRDSCVSLVIWIQSLFKKCKTNPKNHSQLKPNPSRTQIATKSCFKLKTC